jgi:hypothetical protein
MTQTGGKKRAKLDIITCPQWGARKPKQRITTVGAAIRFIQHHTAGHVRQLSSPEVTTKAEAMRPPVTSAVPHGRERLEHCCNFLVCHDKLVLQGRWLTVSRSGGRQSRARCPGQATESGSVQYYGAEPMTDAQRTQAPS